MKTWQVALLFTLFNVGLHAQIMRVATYNIRFDNRHDTLDLWENRFPYVAGLIQLYDFDIFGIQEGLHHQLTDLSRVLNNYSYTGVGRDDGKAMGEYAAIFYKRNRFELTDSGYFWLSEITDKPNKGWDAAFPRICTWGKFRDKQSGAVFYMFNTHLDHLGVKARTESTRLLVNRIIQISGKTPFVLTGDFNYDQSDANYLLLKSFGMMNDTYDIAELRFAPGGTFNAFDIKAKPVGRIDHIFVSENFSVKRYGILTNAYNAHYPSDHFAVMAEILL